MGCTTNSPGEKVGGMAASFHTHGRSGCNFPIETGVIPFKGRVFTPFSPREIEENVVKRYIPVKLLVSTDPCRWFLGDRSWSARSGFRWCETVNGPQKRSWGMGPSGALMHADCRSTVERMFDEGISLNNTGHCRLRGDSDDWGLDHQYRAGGSVHDVVADAAQHPLS